MVNWFDQLYQIFFSYNRLHIQRLLVYCAFRKEVILTTYEWLDAYQIGKQFLERTIMSITEYEEIGNFIYDNGRVIADENGDDDESFLTEFHFEAKQRGFTDEEIEIAFNTYL